MEQADQQHAIEEQASAQKLVWACGNSSLEDVKLLLDGGASIDAVNEEGFTPLAVVSQQGNVKLAALLLDRGARVDFGTRITPLAAAAQGGHLEMVKLLLERGALLDSKIFNPLLEACAQGQLEVVKFLLECGASFQVAKTEDSNPLIAAAQGGHKELVIFLLDSGVEVDAKSWWNATPLFKASFQNNTHMVKLLIERGAKVNHKNFYGQSAVSVATSTEVIEILLASGAVIEDKELAEYINDDKLDLAELVLQYHPKLSVASEFMNQLCRSMHGKSYKLLKTFVENGADVRHKRYIELSVTHKQASKVLLFALYGADTSVCFKEKVWPVGERTREVYEALLHFWTPQNHKVHPRWVREAIVCSLLVAKVQKWPFDRPLLHKIVSYVAYGWYMPYFSSRAKFRVKKLDMVASWSWTPSGDNCAICRNHIMYLCVECQATEGSGAVAGECSVAWGVCNHAFHLHCITRWLHTRHVCPLDLRDWEFQQYQQ